MSNQADWVIQEVDQQQHAHPHPVQKEHPLLGRRDLERCLKLADKVIHVEMLMGCDNVLEYSRE